VSISVLAQLTPGDVAVLRATATLDLKVFSRAVASAPREIDLQLQFMFAMDLLHVIGIVVIRIQQILCLHMELQEQQLMVNHYLR
jgi:hypothetical protein